jgi:hypothetical protein
MKSDDGDRIVCPHCYQISDWPIGSISDNKWNVVKCRLCKERFEVYAKVVIHYDTRRAKPRKEAR